MPSPDDGAVPDPCPFPVGPFGVRFLFLLSAADPRGEPVSRTGPARGRVFQNARRRAAPRMVLPPEHRAARNGPLLPRKRGKHQYPRGRRPVAPPGGGPGFFLLLRR